MQLSVFSAIQLIPYEKPAYTITINCSWSNKETTSPKGLLNVTDPAL